MIKKPIHRRRWLKPGDPETLSYIAYTVDRYNTSVVFTDCYKQVTIGVYQKKDIKKIDILIEELQKFRQLIEENVDERF